MDDNPGTETEKNSLLPAVEGQGGDGQKREEGERMQMDGKDTQNGLAKEPKNGGLTARVTEGGEHLQPNPEQSANWISRILFTYMTPFLIKGVRRTLQENDMFKPLPRHESERAMHKLEREISKYGILLFIEEMIHLVQPLFIGRLIRYFQYNSSFSTTDAYIAAVGVALCAFLGPAVHHPYFYAMQKVGLEMKVAASSLIMNKGLQISSAALHKTTVGHMVNLLSTDVAKLDMVVQFFHYIFVVPLLLVIYIYLLWVEIGWSSFAGLAVLLVMLPLQAFYAKQMGKTRRDMAKRSDKRISAMSEILQGILVVKMYAWEEAFSRVIGKLRAFDMEMVRAHAINHAMVMGLFWASGKLIVLFAVICYYLIEENVTTDRVFVAAALYNLIRLPVNLFLPFAIQCLFEGKTTIQRVQEFLELEDYGQLAVTSEQTDDAYSADKASITAKYTKTPKGDEDKKLLGENGDFKMIEKMNKNDERKNEECILEMDDVTCTWDLDENKESSQCSVAIQDVSFSAKPGQIIIIVGPVGAGKSTLLHSILGEIRKVQGSIRVNGSIAYCSQEAWIFNGTIRDNILFGNAFNESNYRKAITTASLEMDIEKMPNADGTLVGERGASLSGGQRARLALARAIYADADIYLLDDPLSAVDAHVSRMLFEKYLFLYFIPSMHSFRCIRGVLSSKIVLLVTHQLQLISPNHQVVLMDQGRIIASGTMAQLRSNHSAMFNALLHEGDKSVTRSFSESASIESERHLSVSNSDIIEDDLDDVKAEEIKKETKEYVPDTQEEDRNDGSVDWRYYGIYTTSMFPNKWLVVPLAFFTVFVQFLFNFLDWWLTKWMNACERAQAQVNGTIWKDYKDKVSMLSVWQFQLSLNDYMYSFVIVTLVFALLAVLRCIVFRVTQTKASRVLHRNMVKAVLSTDIAFFDKNPVGRILNRFSKDVGVMDDPLACVFLEFIGGALNLLGIVLTIVFLNLIVFLPTLPLLIVLFLLRYIYLQSSRDTKRLEATTRSPMFSHISSVMSGLITIRASHRQQQMMDKFHRAQNVNTAAFNLSLLTSRWFAVQTDGVVACFVTIVALFSLFSPFEMTSGGVALMLTYVIKMTGFFSWIARQSAEMENGMVSIERIVKYTELEPEKEPLITAKLDPEWPQHGRIQINNLFLKYDKEFVLKDISVDIKPKEKIGIVGRTGAGKSSLLRTLFRLVSPTQGTILIDSIDTSTIRLRTLRKSISIIPQEPVLFVGSLRSNLDPFEEYSDEILWDALEQVELKNLIAGWPQALNTPINEGGTNLSVLKDGELMEMGPAHELISSNTSILASFVEETGKSTAQILKKMAYDAYQKQQANKTVN
ncbi:hypothetical protein WR25_02213 [Diploscapter pachys]|uniref:Cystic fibrosis transmembrane conductance regulator n=1 Tax=Diploscapter pachys TaxID=2018661 RepID=A0A2A2J9G8_9BILA|nr:hypothetical protein WR25_02213 [Diploscapter pachys]